AEMGLVHVPRARARHVLAGERDPAAGRLAEAGEGLDELVLAVPGDAGDTEDLARANLEVDPPDDLMASVVVDPEALDLERHVGGMRLAAIDAELDVSPDHQLGEVVLGRLLRQS